MMSSPFLIKLAATFNSEQHLCFLLELGSGGDIFSLYNRRNLYGSMDSARFYTACAVRALVHLHMHFIMYRDLKPENMLLDHKGFCKLTDFGLAKIAVGHTFTTVGTPDYFSPEMATSRGHTSAVDCGPWVC